MTQTKQTTPDEPDQNDAAEIHQTAGDHATQIGQARDVHIHSPTPPPPVPPSPSTSVPRAPAPLEPAAGSPFVVGRPLRASEPIFGRVDVFRFIAGELAKFSSVNLVGERRMGKTSLLNHLLGCQDQCLTPQPDHPPLVLACLDLQAAVTDAARFYGAGLRELLDHLPPSRSAEAGDLQDLRARLHARPEADYDAFQHTLRRLRDTGGLCVRPVLIVDEFERLLDPTAEAGYPFPGFFDGIRALITADLLAMIVASRCPLANYFRHPDRPHTLTSTFPSYFTPFTLQPLEREAADALLLQPSDYPLTVQQAAQAHRWAGGHPCHLQAAGQAWYQAQASDRPPEWARRRFEELKGQNCMTGQEAEPQGWVVPIGGVLSRTLRRVFLDLPIAIGRIVQHLGARLDDAAAWLIAAALILVLILVLLGVATGRDVLDVIKKGLGL